jgi:hypothetical protein
MADAMDGLNFQEAPFSFYLPDEHTPDLFAGLDNPPAFPTGLELPGDFPGYASGIQHEDLPPVDGFPQGNNMGVANNDGVPDRDGDLSQAAGYTLFGSLSGRDAGYTDMGDVTGVFDRLERDSGDRGSTDGGPVRGFDAMRGLVVGERPAPMGEQDENHFASGGGDRIHTRE